MAENKKVSTKTTRQLEKEKSLQYQRDRDKQMVRGIFKFYEIPGGTLNFFYRKYKDEEVQEYTLVDGEQYTIPYGVAKHLNTEGWYPVHKYIKDDSGKYSTKIGRKIRRFGFHSLDFSGEDELQPQKDILTVEYAKK